jgi:hypothetical protein
MVAETLFILVVNSIDVAFKKFRTERKIFKDISKSQSIVDFIIKKIYEFDSKDKSLQNYS